MFIVLVSIPTTWASDEYKWYDDIDSMLKKEYVEGGSNCWN